MPPLLKTLRWLSISLLVKSKVFKVCLQSLYISKLSSPPAHHVSHTGCLAVPETCWAHNCLRAFASPVPSAWHILPPDEYG